MSRAWGAGQSTWRQVNRGPTKEDSRHGAGPWGERQEFSLSKGLQTSIHSPRGAEVGRHRQLLMHVLDRVQRGRLAESGRSFVFAWLGERLGGEVLDSYCRAIESGLTRSGAFDQATQRLPWVRMLITAGLPAPRAHPGAIERGDDSLLRHRGDLPLLEGPATGAKAWLVTNATSHAGLYLGLKDGVTEQALTAAHADAKPVLDLMQRISPEVGRWYLIEPGILHTLHGLSVLEVGQPAGPQAQFGRSTDRSTAALAATAVNFDPAANQAAGAHFAGPIELPGCTAEVRTLAPGDSLRLSPGAHALSAIEGAASVHSDVLEPHHPLMLSAKPSADGDGGRGNVPSIFVPHARAAEGTHLINEGPAAAALLDTRFADD